MTPLIFHITDQSTWVTALQAKTYRADSLSTEGFIHCSQHYQVCEVADLLFLNQKNLLLLAIDVNLLKSPVKYEGPSWNTFPHIYGEVNTDAVVATFPFSPSPATKKFEFPEEALQLVLQKISKIKKGPAYHIPRHYDAMNTGGGADVQFYLSQATSKSGEVLDLACGTGRFTLPIAKAGLSVTGLDMNEFMLNHAKEKAKNQNLSIDFQLGDIRQFHLKKKFDFIFCGFNSSQHLLEEKEFRSFLECVRDHLHHDGIFAFDVFNPSIAMLNRDPAKKYLVTQYPDPDGRGIVQVYEHPKYDSVTQKVSIRYLYELNGETLFQEDFTLRCYFPLELDVYLRNAGFQILKKFGSFQREPFQSNSMKQIYLTN